MAHHQLFVQFHSDVEGGSPDYCFVLKAEFKQDGGQWVGVSLELGTAVHADTLQQAQEELQEAINLQLNEMEKLTDMYAYLAECDVVIVPFPTHQEAGFATAGSLTPA